MEDITNSKYNHAKRVCKDFKIKIFGWVSWLVSSKWKITVGQCFWKL